MPFSYQRIIHFQDTDAAGVVYFANVLAICHEAYEASLAASGIDLNSFFRNPSQAIPVTHAEVDFFRPMFCGDRQQITLTPKQLSDSEFEIAYQILPTTSEPLAAVASKPSARALTRHVSIDLTHRTRQPVSVEMLQWLQQWRQEE